MIDTNSTSEIVRAADCHYPTSTEAEAFLLEVADEAREWDGDPEDAYHEIADGAVYRLESRGTAGKWQVFVELGAYTEDVSDFGPMDMDRQANVALYQIAERLAYAILSERELQEV